VTTEEESAPRVWLHYYYSLEHRLTADIAMSFLYDWMRQILNFLGIMDLEAKMLFLGLDNAGKTTLLGTLSQKKVMSCRPTTQPNQQELTLGGLSFRTFDMGGHRNARGLWRDYLIDVDVIVFVVDASDRDRFPEANEVLHELLKLDQLSQVPFLILGNKIDLQTAVSEHELKEALAIHYTSGKGKVQLEQHIRPIEVFMCSIARGQGYAEGFRWVAQYVKGK